LERVLLDLIWLAIKHYGTNFINKFSKDKVKKREKEETRETGVVKGIDDS